MYTDRPLPGFAHDMIRVDLHHRGRGVYDLWVWRCEGPGFLHKDQADHYEALTLGEALDVVGAVFDGEYGA